MGLPRWVGRAIGLDVHRDFCVVAICEDGVTRSAGRVPSTPEGLRALAESLSPTDRVALEVTGSCWEVVRILEPRVQRVVVVSPDDTGISSARAKTDKLDARKLATLLWKGELEAVWVPDERCRILRRRLARREQLMRARTRSKNEIHAALQRRLQAKPPCSDLFGVKGRRWLGALQLPLEERESVDAAIRHIEFLDAEIAAVERLIAQQALSWPEIRRLMTVPGVNLIGAASFIAAVGNADRFLTSRRLVAYLGLDPKVKQSGEAPARSGRISKRGSASAWAATRVLSAHPRAARSRQGDRRYRPQAGDPVLVHAHPLRGLRPPTTLTDPQEAAATGDHRRRSQEHTPCRGDLVHQRPHACRRARTRRASRTLIQATGPRPASRWTGEKGGRERDTGARIDQGPRRASRAAGSQAPDACRLTRHRLAPNHNLTRSTHVDHPDDDRPCANTGHNRANPTTHQPNRPHSRPSAALNNPPRPIGHPKTSQNRHRNPFDFHRSIKATLCT